MAHEALLAELEKRKQAARAMGGPDETCQAQATRPAQCRRTPEGAGRQGQFHRSWACLGRPRSTAKRRIRRATERSPVLPKSTRVTSVSLSTNSPPRALPPARPTPKKWATSAGSAPSAACLSSISENLPAPGCPMPWAPRAWATFSATTPPSSAECVTRPGWPPRSTHLLALRHGYAAAPTSRS